MEIDLRDLKAGDKVFIARYGNRTVKRRWEHLIYLFNGPSIYNDGRICYDDKYASCAHDEKEYLAYVQWIVDED